MIHAGEQYRIITVERNDAWRRDPRVRAVALTVAHEAWGDAPGAGDAVDALLNGDEHLVQARSGGTTRRLGVSASHEGARTYVAFAPGPVATDACDLSRADEVATAATVAFSRDEYALLESAWDLCSAWTALECRTKLGGGRIVDPLGRRPVAQPKPAGGVAFAGTTHLRLCPAREGAGESTCIGIAVDFENRQA